MRSARAWASGAAVRAAAFGASARPPAGRRARHRAAGPSILNQGDRIAEPPSGAKPHNKRSEGGFLTGAAISYQPAADEIPTPDTARPGQASTGGGSGRPLLTES